MSLRLTSSAFDHDQPIPRHYTCEGDDVSPPLAWEGLPDGTAEVALIMDDPDAPHGTFVHWVIWGLDPASGGLEEGQVPSTASEGGNDFGNRGYGGPCPPKGHGTHRYVFTLMALSEPLSLAPGASSDDVRQAAQATTLDTATLIGLYSR